MPVESGLSGLPAPYGIKLQLLKKAFNVPGMDHEEILKRQKCRDRADMCLRSPDQRVLKAVSAKLQFSKLGGWESPSRRCRLVFLCSAFALLRLHRVEQSVQRIEGSSTHPKLLPPLLFQRRPTMSAVPASFCARGARKISWSIRR